LVTVSGIVGEGFQQTRIQIKSANGVVVASHGNRLPSAVKIDPPPDISEALVYFESLEGMLVELPGTAVTVGPTNRYGEFAVVLEEHKIGRVFQGGQTGLVIRADDGSSEEHETQEKLPAVVSVGDRVNNLIGPLAFTYGDYKIEPIEPVEVISAGFQVEAREPLNEDQFSLMTWNVENLFDFTEPHPSSPSMPSVIEYKLALEKIASTILFAGVPTLVGLQEVENIEILEDIAALESLAAYQYVPLLIEGTDSRYIDVGYLLRGDIADLIDLEQFPAPEGITSRPPLLIEFSLQGGPSVYVLNNHFTSMSGGEAATEPRRNAQAAWNVEIAGDIFAENPEAYLAVMGDLNSYLSSLPIDTLRAAGLHDVLDQLPPEEQYTYVYQGVSQVLDHILVSDSLIELIEEIYVLHTNADYPPPPAGDTSPYHQSDHDPVITIFSLPQ
jgi:predicted extracellular nuclease